MRTAAAHAVLCIGRGQGPCADDCSPTPLLPLLTVCVPAAAAKRKSAGGPEFTVHLLTCMYVNVHGDYAGRVSGAVFDLTDPDHPKQLDLTVSSHSEFANFWRGVSKFRQHCCL